MDTTLLKTGYIRRNGLPRSENAVLREHFIRNGDVLTWEATRGGAKMSAAAGMLASSAPASSQHWLAGWAFWLHRVEPPERRRCCRFAAVSI